MNKVYIIFTIFLLLLSCKTIDKNVINYDNKYIIKNIKQNRSNNPLYREFRAAWLSTVANIDFPVKGGSEEEQKELILKHLNTLYENNFNAVFVQVKPDAGVIYKSDINPTTRYFFGDDEKDERDDYPFQTDMLEFIIDEAHKRNIEVHAWFNPYRISLAAYNRNKSLSEQFSRKNFIHKYIAEGLEPIEWYDKRLYIDPGEPISSEYVIDTIIEVVEKYDIDGIHFDDYFYQNAVGSKTYKDWPDSKSSEKYAKKSGFDYQDTSYDDHGKNGLYAWRRNNINNLISTLYKEIKSRKPYVKWTISPAGVWRNKEQLSEYKGSRYGSDTKSYNPNFDALHADVLIWLLNGKKTISLNKATRKDGINKMYIDAIIPQVYWTSNHTLVPFDTIVKWWVNEAKKSHYDNLADIYIGHALYRMGSTTKTEPWKNIDTMSKQVEYIRDIGEGYIKGSSFFTLHNMYYNDRDTGDYGANAIKHLRENNYIFKAIIPKMNTMKHLNNVPKAPEKAKINVSRKEIEISFIDSTAYNLDKYNHPKVGTTVYYAIYRKDKNGIQLLDTIRRTNYNKNSEVKYVDTNISRNEKYTYYITSLDRIHNESKYIEISK